MHRMVVRGAPEGLTDDEVARLALRPAIERGADTIVVVKQGHTTEIHVADLVRALRTGAIPAIRALQWSALEHRAMGSVLERHQTVWPGGCP